MNRLRVKEEYKEFSIGGGRFNKIKLKNLDPSSYEFLYKNGYEEFFYVEVKENITKTKKEAEKPSNDEENKD